MARGTKKGFCCGAILGGLIGSAFALLYAPKSGNKLRKELSKKYDGVTEKAQDMMDDVCCQTEELVEKAKLIAEDARACASRCLRKRK